METRPEQTSTANTGHVFDNAIALLANQNLRMPSRLNFYASLRIKRLSFAIVDFMSRRALRQIVRKSQGFIDINCGLLGDVSLTNPSSPAVVAKMRVS